MLERGTPLFRIHSPDYPANAMNPRRQETTLGGGRFDSLDGDYSYLYVAGDLEGALAERVFRDLPLDGRPRIVPKEAWQNTTASELVVTADISTIACHGAALAHLGQDHWLHDSDPRDYIRTRMWASAIRDWVPDADGLAYRCRNDNDRLAAVLFGPVDQKVMPILRVQRSSPIEDALNMDLLRRVALRHNAILSF